MSDTPLVAIEPEASTFVDAPLPLEVARNYQKQLNAFIASQMREGVDYGVIPGTKKKSLWKPGSEKLLYYNGLCGRLEPAPGTVVDWKAGFFNYEYKATVYSKKTGKVFAEYYGSCNSKEDKYAYNWVYETRIPKGLKKEDLETKKMKSKEGGTYLLYRIENNDPYSLVNTFQKMAQKRALISATVLACRASENFTTDLEEGEEPLEPITQSQPSQTKDLENPGKTNGPSKPISSQNEKGVMAEAISPDTWQELVSTAKRAGVSESNLKTFIVNHFDYLKVQGEAGSFSDPKLLRVSDVKVVMDWLASDAK